MALSQHGTVAPIIVHHRVDFAASMVDGRSVGEVVPKSQSAKEVRELWTYVQDRLARLAKDPSLAPEFRPRHLDLGPLAAIEDSDLAATSTPEAPPLLEPLRDPAIANHTAPPTPERGCDGAERRLGAERRAAQAPLFGAPDKRVHVFGRRHTDRPAEH